MVDSLRFRTNIKKVIQITLFWIIISVFLALFEHTGFASVNFDFKGNPEYNLWISIKTYVLAAFLGGITIGSIEFFFLRDRTRNYSFGKLFLIKSIIYLFVILLLNVVASLFYNSTLLGLPPYHWSVIEGTIRFLSNFGLVRNVITWTLITMATLILLMINDKFGQGMMRRMILGRYNRPREENRIFMFLDIRSSTTIAEKLGHLNYFNLLKDFFSDITNSIVDRKGEIYQYVGDEVIISWTMKNGLTDANCIQCFYDIKKALGKQTVKYMHKYGLTPSFKAGLHYGSATTGEIGVIKKEIVFSGDVINTTARIQDLCNSYNVDILLSKRLFDLLPKLNIYNYTEIGEMILRGKEDKVMLYTVHEVAPASLVMRKSVTADHQ
jgi:adenylate cyclase